MPGRDEVTNIALGSERNLVIHIVATAAATAASASHRRTARCGRARRAEVAVASAEVGRARAAARAIEHRQRRVEALQHDLGRVAVLPVLVLPFARLQRALEINLAALLQILLGDL